MSNLLPWAPLGLSREFSTQNSETLQNSWKTFKQQNLPTSVSLYQYGLDKTRTFTYNMRRKAEQIAVSKTPLRPSINESSYLIPFLCGIEKRLIVGLQWALTADNELLGLATMDMGVTLSSHSSAILKENELTVALARLLQNVRSQGQNAARMQSPVKLSVSLRKGGLSQEKGAYLCHSLRVASKLVDANYRVLSFIEQENVQSIGRSLGMKMNAARANRNLNLNWNFRLNDNKEKLWTFEWTMVEAVFGRSRLHRSTSPEIKTEQLIADFRLPQNLVKAIEEEQRVLRSDELPMVSKIYGAWVYLDRGRAWGLETKDRLWLRDETGESIKAHVIGFYTKEAGIQSPRGFPVQEGAIAYVRKGQNRVAVGQIFDFDPTEFPTPWPPEETP